jgi:hypothetical protein
MRIPLVDESVQEEASHQVVLYGIAGGRAAGGNSQFAVDRAHMRIDGDQANDELLGNLRTTQALCRQAEHLDLTRSQTIRVEVAPLGCAAGTDARQGPARPSSCVRLSRRL